MDITRLWLDFETYSELDVSSVGVSRYARHPSTEVIMLSYAFDDDPWEQWVPAEGEEMPRRLLRALRDPDVVKFAWNVMFERAIFEHVLGLPIPYREWRDVMVMAYAVSLPGKLEHAGKVLRLPADKQKLARGKALVRRFCQPRKPTEKKPWRRCTHLTDPEEWEEFKQYGGQDIEAMRAIWHQISRWDLPRQEWRYWCLDQEINDKGIPVNLRVARNAIRVHEDFLQARLDEMRRLTGLINPNSQQQLLGWLKDHGYPYDDVKKGHVAQAIEKAENSRLRRVLELRQEVSRTSAKKYYALVRATDDDGMLRGAFQFLGASRTGRWAGRLYQAQNLPRPPAELEKHLVEAVEHLEGLDAGALALLYPRPADVLVGCLRPVLQAPKGYVFADADLNAIENRGVGWLAEDRKILRVFAQGRDPYVDFSTYMFGGTYAERYAEYKAGNKERRTLAKPAVLGAGYMLGKGEVYENEKTGELEATGLLGYAWSMGIRMTPEQSAHAVQVWRETFTDVVAYWAEIDRAARRCIRTGRPTRAGRLKFDMSGEFMRMHLPSGRCLFYCRPKLLNRRTPWGEVRPTITYEGLNDQKQWVRLTTHPGKLFENAVQALARDILVHGMWLARKRKLDIRLHVHDQVVVLAREDEGETALAILRECLSTPPAWAPDIPLAAEGFVSRVFLKD